MAMRKPSQPWEAKRNAKQGYLDSILSADTEEMTWDEFYQNIQNQIAQNPGSNYYRELSGVIQEYDRIYEDLQREYGDSLVEKYGSTDKLAILQAHLRGEGKMTAGEIAAQQPNNTEVYLRALAQDRIGQQLRRSNSLSAFHSAQRPRFLTGGL